jgi:hypothetical protein
MTFQICFRNPNVPTVHFNYRYFEVQESSGKIRCGFKVFIIISLQFLSVNYTVFVF